MSEYRVDVDAYNGPLDLLLFLIHREEVDIYDISIARIAEQYCGYVEVLQIIDPNVGGDFLVMMATLMEIKSRALLPRTAAVDEEDDFQDPRLELIRQLLAYKTFKDAARELGTAAEIQSLRFPRQPVDPASESGELDLEDVSVWTLVNAFGELLEQTGKGKLTHDVVYDETPLALHADDIVDSLQHNDGSQFFEFIFSGRSKAEMIGLFLALLELIRRRRIRVTQERQFGPVTIHLIDSTPLDEAIEEAEEADPDEPERAPGGSADGSMILPAGHSPESHEREGPQVDIRNERAADGLDSLPEQTQKEPLE